jgi:hypothetical protein
VIRRLFKIAAYVAVGYVVLLMCAMAAVIGGRYG